MIKTGKHIDANGKIYLPYLHEWKHVSMVLTVNIIKQLELYFLDICSSGSVCTWPEEACVKALRIFRAECSNHITY